MHKEESHKFIRAQIRHKVKLYEILRVQSETRRYRKDTTQTQENQKKQHDKLKPKGPWPKEYTNPLQRLQNHSLKRNYNTSKRGIRAYNAKWRK